MDFLRCIVERITYQNDDNGYCVIKVKAKNYSDLVTVVGNMASFNVGSGLFKCLGPVFAKEYYDTVNDRKRVLLCEASAFYHQHIYKHDRPVYRILRHFHKSCKTNQY
jgi:hypothetical protein